MPPAKNAKCAKTGTKIRPDRVRAFIPYGAWPRDLPIFNSFAALASFA
jgi:hypothetical protein